jgi:hopene-associated glycosyltransferase HpnB
VPFTSLLIAAISLAIWLYLSTARGNFWRLSDFDDDTAKHEPPVTWPQVVAIVPARNEAPTIAQTVRSLLHQDYPGQFFVIVVDDHSEDDTAQIAKQTARNLSAESRIEVRIAAPLPPGWTGKLWALNSGTAIFGCAPTTSTSSGASAISRTTPNDPSIPFSSPAYYWFTDADILHAPNTLSRLVARAEHDHLDLTSLMVQLQAKSFPERALIPAFLFFFLKLYPPTWIANPRKPTAGAAGGCILLRRQALEKIGGLSAIRQEVIDDCALARAVKFAPSVQSHPRHPEARRSSAEPKDLNESPLQSHNDMREPSTGRIWMGLTRASLSLRAYTTFREIRDMIARTAFTQLRYSTPLLLATLLAMFLTYIAPIVLLFAPHPTTRILAAATWLLMSLLYLPTIRFYRLNPGWAATLPLTAAFYSYATILSAIRHYQGRGAQWKGRAQAL